MHDTVLVTGATGKTADLVARQLRAKGREVRALVRSETKAAGLREAGIGLALGDYNDPPSLARALEGVTSVFFVVPPSEHDGAMIEHFLTAARASVTRPRIVRLSAIKATEGGPSESTRSHGRADRALIESGLPYAILRPNYFMQNFFGSAETILSSGTLVHAVGDGRVGFIDVRDVADVVVAVLLDASWDRGIYDLTGPASLSFQDAARAFSAALGRPVTCVAVTPAAVRANLLEKGWGPWGASLMADYSAAYAAGWGDFTTSFVQKITGRDARSVEQFAREVFAPALMGQVA